MIIYGLFSSLVLTLACTGYGRLLLTLLSAKAIVRNKLEWFILCFTTGQGFLGWILYFPGVFQVFSYNVIISILSGGIFLYFVFYFQNCKGIIDWYVKLPSISVKIFFIAIAMILIIAIDVFEAIAPPADADTLAYHFALPKQFLYDDAIVFFPKAVDAAVPLLIHMTYAAALEIGGETSLTFWTMITGWNTSLLVFVAAKRYLPEIWAFLSAVAFLSTPAVLFGAGTGQVEIRCAAFVIASVLFLIETNRAPLTRYIILAGLFAGFYVGSKYFGLFFVLASIPVLLFQKYPLRNVTIYSSTILIVGFQWYLWNFIHTNDPVFPSITNILQVSDPGIWSQDFGTYFNKMLRMGDVPLKIDFLNWLFFPFIASFNLIDGLNAGRTGFGLMLVLIFPMTIIGLFQDKPTSGKFLIPLSIIFLFFTIWFFSGTTQRVRHLLPIYPLLLIICISIACFFFNRLGAINLLGLCFFIVIGNQTVGQMVFGYNYAKFIFLGEARKSFLERNIPVAKGVHWVNKNLPSEARIAHYERGIAYLFKNPSFMLHPFLQKIVDVRPTINNDARFVSQLKAQGITHLMVPNWQNNNVNSQFQSIVIQLMHNRCLKTLWKFDAIKSASRTLASLGVATLSNSEYLILKINYNLCPKY